MDDPRWTDKLRVVKATDRERGSLGGRGKGRGGGLKSWQMSRIQSGPNDRLLAIKISYCPLSSARVS